MTQYQQRRRNMKKRNKFLLLIIMILSLSFITTGCETDTMEGVDIVVTNYPTEYIVKSLYDDHANIESIYPDGITIEQYKISKKQKEDFAKKDVFVYNGLIEKERNLAIDLLAINKDLKIIDTAYVLETKYSPEELWLNPSLLLMMSENVKMGIDEYATSTYIKKDVEEKYKDLKVKLSELDAEYREAVNNTNDKTIVVADSALKYLEKFGLTVYCIDNDASDKTIATVNNLISKKEISYIIKFKNKDLPENAQTIIDKNPDIKTLELHKLDNITDIERKNKSDYISIMQDNLNTLKSELYQ